MPTVPNFTDDQERLAWLRQNFNSRGDYEEKINVWDTRAQRCDSAVSGAGYTAGIVVTILSTIQTSITGSGHEGNATNVINYIQTGIGICSLVIGGVCKLIKDSNVKARDTARGQFSPTFFQQHADDTIWEAQAVTTTRNHRGACLC